jgi:hypothetical protein
MRAQPNPAVLNWFAAQRRDAFYISVIKEAELRTGAAIRANCFSTHDKTPILSWVMLRETETVFVNTIPWGR